MKQKETQCPVILMFALLGLPTICELCKWIYRGLCPYIGIIEVAKQTLQPNIDYILCSSNPCASTFFVYSANHTLKCFAWTAFYKFGCAIGYHILYAFGPTNTRCKLCYKVCLNFGSIGVWLSVYILINWAFWRWLYWWLQCQLVIRLLLVA